MSRFEGGFIPKNWSIYIFELFVSETNLKKKRSVILRPVVTTWRLKAFINYSRLSNRRRLLNKSSLNFHIMILIHFYTNLGIGVIFDFFCSSTFSKKNLIYK